MSTLSLRLAGPLQSWGAASRFTRRATETAPTKSGILGLLAAAQGRRRSDPIEELLNLELAVRIDQQGVLLRDFHTAHHQTTGKSMPLTERYYWSDAVFVAFIGGPRPLLEGLAEALENPAFPIYLGRRSCVPDGRVVLDITDSTVEEALHLCSWQASKHTKRRHREASKVTVAVRADVSVFPDSVAARELNDIPVSWSQEHRQYRSRMVVDTRVDLVLEEENPVKRIVATPDHDPMAFLEDS